MLNSKFKGVEETISTITLLSYIENDLFVVYAPTLDLFGYGHSELEATQSFEIVLKEYLDHVKLKNSMWKDLKKLGWKISKNKISQPELSNLLLQNETLKEVVNHKVFKKSNYNFSIQDYK